MNIGNSSEHTILELIDFIREMIKCDSKIIYKKLPQNDPLVRRPDISLAKKILGWNPEVKLSEGLKKTIDYFYNLKKWKKYSF